MYKETMILGRRGRFHLPCETTRSTSLSLSRYTELCAADAAGSLARVSGQPMCVRSVNVKPRALTSSAKLL